MISSPEYTKEQWATLCQKVQELVPAEIGTEAWYLIIASALGTSPEVHMLGAFYSYLTSHDPSFISEESKERLSQRFRDVLFKLLSLVGGPQLLSVLMPLAQAEGDITARSHASKLNPKWQASSMNVQAIYERGNETINNIYGKALLPKIFNTWGSHKEDMVFNEIFTFYGMYLSDFEIMTPLETEAVVYASISCLGLGGPGNWHLRGMGRVLGARGQDDASSRMSRIKSQVMQLRQAVMLVVEFVGDEFMKRAKPEKWAKVDNMLRDFGGWGEE